MRSRRTEGKGVRRLPHHIYPPLPQHALAQFSGSCLAKLAVLLASRGNRSTTTIRSDANFLLSAATCSLPVAHIPNRSPRPPLSAALAHSAPCRNGIMKSRRKAERRDARGRKEGSGFVHYGHPPNTAWSIWKEGSRVCK